MGFIAKGENIIIEGGSSGIGGSSIYKRQKQDGTFENVNWGSLGTDFDTPIVNSTWTTYGTYKYLPLAVVRQVYSEEHIFDRNMRFDTSIRFTTTVAPVGSDISKLEYITALIKGEANESTNSLVQKVIDEYLSETYQNVLAIGKLNQDIADLRAVNIDVNDIKTYAGAGETTQDYRLPIGDSVYLVNIVLVTNADIEDITSLSINIYQQQFCEFYGNGTVAPGSIGKTEINPLYKAENAVSNHIITITDEKIVEDSEQNTVVVITPNELTSFEDGSLYFMYFNSSTSLSGAYVSLGIYDMTSEQYVPVGTKYPLTASSVNNKVATVTFINGEFTAKAL